MEVGEAAEVEEAQPWHCCLMCFVKRKDYDS